VDVTISDRADVDSRDLAKFFKHGASAALQRTTNNEQDATWQATACNMQRTNVQSTRSSTLRALHCEYCRHGG
jgi:hypothetical protein